MATLQKVLSNVLRELKDEELDMVGGLAGSKTVTETWVWCGMPTGAPPPGPATVWVADSVTTTEVLD